MTTEIKDLVTQAELVDLARDLDVILTAGHLHTLHDEIGYRARQRQHRLYVDREDVGYAWDVGRELSALLGLRGDANYDRCRSAGVAAVFGDHRADVLGAIRMVAQECRDREAAKTLARTGRPARRGAR